MIRKLLIDFIRIVKTLLPVKVYQKLLAPVVSEGYAMYSKMSLASSVIKARPSSGPSFVIIGPISNCNFRCYFCHTHSYCIPDGKFSDAKNELYYRDFFAKKSNLVMPLDMYKSLIDDLAKLKVLFVDLSGIGEPLLHPDIVEMVSYANEKNIACGLTTNGSLLDTKIIDELIQAGLKNMTISINSLNSETYNLTHGIKNDKTLERLKESIAYLTARKKTVPNIVTAASFCISKINRNELSDFNMFADFYKFNAVNYTPYHSLQYASEFILNEREVDEIVTELNQITGKDHSIFKKLWYQSNYANKVSSSCYTGYNFSFINSNGDVFPCCGCKHTVGNLKYDNFAVIWNGESYKTFRKKALLIHKDGNHIENCDCSICPEPSLQALRLGRIGRLLQFHINKFY